MEAQVELYFGQLSLSPKDEDEEYRPKAKNISRVKKTAQPKPTVKTISPNSITFCPKPKAPSPIRKNNRPKKSPKQFDNEEKALEDEVSAMLGTVLLLIFQAEHNKKFRPKPESSD